MAFHGAGLWKNWHILDYGNNRKYFTYLLSFYNYNFYAVQLADRVDSVHWNMHIYG